jgi:hypothetical protein
MFLAANCKERRVLSSGIQRRVSVGYQQMIERNTQAASSVLKSEQVKKPAGSISMRISCTETDKDF